MFIAFNETRVGIKRILRNKFKVTLLTTILVFGFFLFFQLLYVQLPSDTSVDNLKSKVGGVRHTNLRLETPDTIQDILVHKKNLEHWDVSSVNKQPQSEDNILKYSKMLNTKSRNSFFVRGGKRSEYHLYRPNENGNFECFTTGMEIDPSKINDDYCDCEEDGSDEPGTSACQNGRFHCNTQLALGSQDLFPLVESIPSHRVNDGICDCCDGSDEWAVKRLHFRLAENIQKHLGRYQSPCTNLCPNK